MCKQSVFTVIKKTCPIYHIPNVKNSLAAQIITLINRKIPVEETYKFFLVA